MRKVKIQSLVYESGFAHYLSEQFPQRNLDQLELMVEFLSRFYLHMEEKLHDSKE